MKNLYKKLYEAINTGIQKALVLDDDEDVSIIYQHSKIVNNTNLMPYYVNELLQDSNNKFINYKQIIKYYKESGYAYKVKDFNELRNIFDKIKDIENASFEWISNMKDYVSIVLDDNSEINFYEEPKENPLFLKLANDDILNTENEILIYLHEKHGVSLDEYRWQSKEVQIQPDEYLINDKNIANKDYSGYENCLRIQDIVSKEPKKYGYISAINQCLKKKVNDYQGYLPSMGQLKILSDNIDMINYIFKYLNLNEIKDLSNDCWWSSTEHNYYNSWYLDYYRTEYRSKAYGVNRIFPLFAVKKIKVI
ncbi:MAG: hypothetical protein [Wendovervirus sonii]|uniref:DUF1566 domain-containing protein n=1 Tax=phage Lak_Megaphage_Sonny TaxID=3109229 RepID=A0ABZ0Z209_9CAUD|nr:MAG: hypothetical protein [phage Lak_Megaphage_Sonny]